MCEPRARGGGAVPEVRVKLLFPHYLPPRPLSPRPTIMSQSHLPSASSSNFQSIFNNALKEYQRRTKKDLLTHPLAAQLQECDSPTNVRAVLQQQVQELQSQTSDDRLTKWLDPTVNVLSALSDTLGEAVGLVCS